MGCCGSKPRVADAASAKIKISKSCIRFVIAVRIIMFVVLVALSTCIGIAIKMYLDGYRLHDFVLGMQCSTGKKTGECRRPYYNIAHMTNTPKSIKLAIERGANAIEADLWFDENTARPNRFYHGGSCDCTCKDILPMESFCQPEADDRSCENSTPASELLSNVKNHDLALFIIDSKIKETPLLDLSAAGASVAEMIWNNTFSPQGKATKFKGFVAIGMASASDEEYLKGAFEWSEMFIPPQARARLLFAIDMDTDTERVLSGFESIGVEGHRRLFGGGITSCVPTPTRCTRLVGEAFMARQLGLFGGIYAWTEDRDGPQRSCHSFIGVDGVITNDEANVASNVEETRTVAKSTNTYFSTPTLQAEHDYVIDGIKPVLDPFGDVHFASTIPDGVKMYRIKQQMMNWRLSITNEEWVDEWQKCKAAINARITWFEKLADEEESVPTEVEAKLQDGTITFKLEGLIPKIDVRYASHAHSAYMQ